MTATPPSRPPRPTILEIDLDAAAANVRAVRQMVGPGRKIFAVVKADGYGHGAAELGAAFVANGADALAVADLAEGIRLRRRGIATPILVYPNSLPEAAPDAIAHSLISTLVDLDAARAYAEAATGPCDVFVKVDVGLERLGVPAEQAGKTGAAMPGLPHLRPLRHLDARRARRSSGVCRGGEGAGRVVVQGRCRAGAPGRAGRAGGEAGRRHAGAAAPAPGRALRSPARPLRCRPRLRRVA